MARTNLNDPRLGSVTRIRDDPRLGSDGPWLGQAMHLFFGRAAGPGDLRPARARIRFRLRGEPSCGAGTQPDPEAPEGNPCLLRRHDRQIRIDSSPRMRASRRFATVNLLQADPPLSFQDSSRSRRLLLTGAPALRRAGSIFEHDTIHDGNGRGYSAAEWMKQCPMRLFLNLFLFRVLQHL